MSSLPHKERVTGSGESQHLDEKIMHQHSDEKIVHRRASHAEHLQNMKINTSAKIQNPLFGLPKDELFADSDQFCDEQGFAGDKELFRKAALIGQNPGRFEQYQELNDDDKHWLRLEKTNKWAQPRTLIFTVVLASVGAAVQGWDQTGSNGANLGFPVEFGIPEDPGPGVSELQAQSNQWIVGLVNSGPYFGAAFFGCWLNDPMNNWLGRRGTIFISAVFCLITPIGSAVSQNWHQLLVCRLLMGIGMGLKASTVPIFTAENVPPSVRGGLVMSWQLWTAFGIFLGTCANLAVFRVGDIAWRLQLGSAFIPAIPLLIGIYFCPESPRWLMKKGKYKRAYASLLRLRNSPLQAARDLYYVHCQLQEEYAATGGSNYLTRFGQLFTIPRVRRATLASFVVMLAQQMCGINIIAFYSSSVFKQAGLPPFNCLMASFGFGLLNFIFAIPAVFTIDTFGRRGLLLSTFPNMAWSLLLTGLMFLIKPAPDATATPVIKGNPARLPLIALFIYIFTIFYSVGEGPVPFAYSAEVFPITHREVGMGWAVATCLFWAGVLGLTWPRMVAAMTPTGAFGFYAALNVTAFVMIFFLLPETKQLTLEELDFVFGVPTSKHAAYQLHTFVPYLVKKYILRKTVTLKPLYNLDELQGIEKDPEFAALTGGAAH